MRLDPPPTEPEIPGQFWIDFIRDTAPVFREPTLQQLGDFIAPTWQALIDGAKYVDPRLTEIFDEVAPDVIVEDNVVAFPAITASDRPWVRIVSCNPMEMKDERDRAVLVRIPRGRPERLAGIPRGGPPDPRRHVDGFRPVLSRTRRAGPDLRPPRPRVHRRVPVAQPLLVPEGSRLRTRPPARADVAAPGLDGPRRGHDLGAARVAGRPRRRTHLSVARVAGRRRMSD